MNDLSVKLNLSQAGCCIDNVFINHLFYADDLCLLAPSPGGLQVLINICYEFGMEHDIIFNSSKSVCMVTKPKRYRLNIPCMYLGDTLINYVEHVKYLGVFIADSLSDDKDIMRQVRSLYARANTLLRKFYNCSYEVKLTLFQSYCVNMYCPYLWTQYTVRSYQKIKVAYNNVFRMLLGYSKRDSASTMFATNGIDSFDAMFRKNTYKCMQRLSESSNVIIRCLVNSYSVRAGPMWSKWITSLYVRS